MFDIKELKYTQQVQKLTPKWFAREAFQCKDKTKLKNGLGTVPKLNSAFFSTSHQDHRLNETGFLTFTNN